MKVNVMLIVDMEDDKAPVVITTPIHDMGSGDQLRGRRIELEIEDMIRDAAMPLSSQIYHHLYSREV